MKLALIPPKGWEGWARQSNFHLALAQVLNPHYDKVYQGIPSNQHVIVDNGAAEGPLVDNRVLMAAAQRWKANEIVLPDVMLDGAATVASTLKFIAEFEDEQPPVHCMAVAQGEDLTEVYECVDELAKISNIRTIGIPRHLIRTCKLREARLRVAEYIVQNHAHLQIHLLGTHPSVPSEVLQAAREAPYIRSVDTSMPFNYAIAGVRLSLTAPAITRPTGYLEEYQDMSVALLRDNIATMKRWVAGNE